MGRKMTHAEFDAIAKRLEQLIAQEDAGKKSDKSLAEKIVHNRVRNLLQSVLQQHRLDYFELVPAS